MGGSGSRFFSASTISSLSPSRLPVGAWTFQMYWQLVTRAATIMANSRILAGKVDSLCT